MAKKTIIRIKERDLQKMIEQAFSEKVKTDESMGSQNKIKLFLSEEDIDFLLDILQHLGADDSVEEGMLSRIKYALKDSLVNT